MTTAFAHAAEARWSLAVTTQPVGALLAVLTASALWACIHVAAFGSRLGPAAARLLKPWVVWSALGFGLAGWGYKVATWNPDDALSGPAPTSTLHRAAERFARPPTNHPTQIQPTEEAP